MYSGLTYEELQARGSAPLPKKSLGAKPGSKKWLRQRAKETKKQAGKVPGNAIEEKEEEEDNEEESQ